MWKKNILWFQANRKTIVITFEIFWIVIFLLDRVISASSSVIPQFVYVNF